MVAIFARDLTGDLARLAKQVDKAVAGNQDKQLSAFLVYLTNDEEAAEKKLARFAEKHGIENVPLTVYGNTAGPPSYKIAKDADVTVLMWRKLEVKANHALADTSRLNKAAVQKIVSDTEKILN